MADVIGTLTKRVLFSPLDDFGRTEAVADRIRSAIMLGIFADGEQLPNEIDLAGQFQVSPVTLRDSLRMIRQEGLARTTRGRAGGTFVIAPDESNMGQFEHRLAETPILVLRDRFDWQAALTGHSAHLAAERAGVSEALSLRAAVDHFGSQVDAPQARRSLSRLLIEVSAAARSARLTREIITHLIEVAPNVMLVLRDAEVRGRCHRYAALVVDAITARNPELASGRAVEFIDSLRDEILERRFVLTQRTPQQEEPNV